MANVYTVKRQAGSSTWGIFRNGELIEGGFFSHGFALDARDGYANADADELRRRQASDRADAAQPPDLRVVE